MGCRAVGSARCRDSLKPTSPLEEAIEGTNQAPDRQSSRPAAGFSGRGLFSADRVAAAVSKPDAVAVGRCYGRAGFDAFYQGLGDGLVPCR